MYHFGSERGGWAGQGHNLLNHQPQFQQRLMMPISHWISVCDMVDMMAPLLKLVWHAARDQVGIPTQSWRKKVSRPEIRLSVWNGWHHHTWSILNPGLKKGHTCSQMTTLGPFHCVKCKPCFQASSNNSCLEITECEKWKSSYYIHV